MNPTARLNWTAEHRELPDLVLPLSPDTTEYRRRKSLDCCAYTGKWTLKPAVRTNSTAKAPRSSRSLLALSADATERRKRHSKRGCSILINIAQLTMCPREKASRIQTPFCTSKLTIDGFPRPRSAWRNASWKYYCVSVDVFPQRWTTLKPTPYPTTHTMVPANSLTKRSYDATESDRI